MAEQVWKTKDGAIFETEKEANDHEAEEALIKNMTEYFYGNSGLLSGQSADVARFLFKNRELFVDLLKPHLES